MQLILQSLFRVFSPTAFSGLSPFHFLSFFLSPPLKTCSTTSRISRYQMIFPQIHQKYKTETKMQYKLLSILSSRDLNAEHSLVFLGLILYSEWRHKMLQISWGHIICIRGNHKGVRVHTVATLPQFPVPHWMNSCHYTSSVRVECANMPINPRLECPVSTCTLRPPPPPPPRARSSHSQCQNVHGWRPRGGGFVAE